MPALDEITVSSINGLLHDPSLFKSFRDHLALNDNSRILFSGRFGIGKSTFLQEFFNKKVDKYNAIHLSPVNYSISPNEDILDLLKYDIIDELINKFPIKTEEYDFSESSVLARFANSHMNEFLVPIFNLMPKIGKLVSSSYKNIVELTVKYKKFKKEVKAGELSDLKKIADKVENLKGSFYQNDFYIDFICRKLLEIQGEGENKKQSVLIIDDLDRIDPEHIFRLFNVFAAHLHGSSEQSNKFGFDKIIFTCDIDNIEAVYHHKYGTKADFAGYIDKFYSKIIYRIDTSSIIDYWIREKSPFDRDNFNQNDSIFLIDVLVAMLDCGVLTFRNIKSMNKELIGSLLEKIKAVNNNGGVFRDTRFIWVAPVLAAVFGDTEKLLEKIDNCKEVTSSRFNKNVAIKIRYSDHYVLSYFVPISEFSTHGNNDVSIHRFLMSSVIPNANTHFEYRLTNENYKQVAVPAQSDNNPTNKITPYEGFFSLYFWDFLLRAIRELQEKAYLS